MKEDAQLICPISYEDPAKLWEEYLEKDIVAKFPLRDVSWRSPHSNTAITIDRLPLRCVSISASLFKDTDHPFRWFLAPYVYLYILESESLDQYKKEKTALKSWVETHSGLKRVSWLIVYVPKGSQTPDMYQKIYAKVSNEFCQDKTGDRSCMVLHSKHFKSLQAHSTSFMEVTAKIRDGVVQSFQQRCGQYDAEIRRLDLSRSGPQFDFKQLFLVKESLALMYQMMQLPGDALVQYEELEVLMDSYAPSSLPETNWPLFSTSASTKGPGGGADGPAERPSETANEASSYIDKEIRGLWYEPAFQGDAVLTYSINHARMRVLKNKMGVLELTHYVFARECFFYFGLGKASLCAEKAMRFVTFADNHLKRRIESGSLLRSTQLDAVAATGEAIKLDSQTLGAMIDLWAVTAVVRVARSCREYTMEASGKNKESFTDAVSEPNMISSSPRFSVEVGSPNNRAANNSNGNNVSSGKNKEPQRSLCNLLQFAHGKLVTSLMSRERTGLSALRKIALEIATKVTSWDEAAREIEKRPNILVSIPDKIVNNNAALKKLRSSSVRHSPIYPGAKVDNDQIEKLDDMLPTFSKALRHMMQAAHILSTMPRPDPPVLSSGRVSSSMTASGTPVSSNGISAATPDSPLVATHGNAEAGTPESQCDKLQAATNADKPVLESQKSRHISMSGVALAWFTAEAKLPMLEVQVVVTLTRLLAEHEGEAGRLRLAFQSKSDCADILLCCGRFDYAKDMLLSALAVDNSLLLASGVAGSTISTRIGGPATELIRKAAATSKRHVAAAESFSSLCAALGAVTCSAGGISTLNYSASIGGAWKLFRYVLLRKILLCASILNDARLYVDVSLRLLDPLMSDLLNKKIAMSLFNDVMVISKASMGRLRSHSLVVSSDLVPLDSNTDTNIPNETSGGYLTSVLPAPMHPHVSMSIKFHSNKRGAQDHLTLDTTDSVWYADLCDRIERHELRVATMRSVTSVIHDEPFKVAYAECEAGRHHILYLNIESHFPTEVTLDNLLISYIPFSLVENGQHSPLQKHGMPGAVGLDTVSEGNNNIGSDFFRHQSFQSFQFGGDLDSATSDSVVNHFGSGQYTSGHINTGFECQPYFSKKDDGRASPRQLVLRPGHQIVPMFFNARAVGEYAPLFISLQIGKVLLVERIDADVNKLHNFFDSNTLISIIKPTDPIGLSILVPPLCPIGYKDSVLVGVELEEKDELHNVEMSVYSVLLDKQFIQSLTLVEDAIERDFLISQYIEAAGDSWLFADDGGQNGAISVETRHAQIDNLVNQYLSPSTGALTETKMLPGTSPRAPLARRPTSHITRDLSNRATGNGDSYDGTIKYGLFVSKPNTWQMCDTTGVHPPRAASVLGRNNLLASAHPKTDIRIIDKVKDTRELIISVPIAAAPLVKQSSDSNNSITVDLPGADDTSILSRSAFPDECFAIVCKIQGRLLRNSCETDFDCQTHSILQCGVPVSISQESVGSIDKEFFHQCVIKNRSNVSFSLNSIRVRSWTAGVPCPRIDLINDDICDLKEITVATSKMRGTSREWNDAGEHSLSLGLFLRPLDSYFFAARFSEQLYVPPPVKHNRLFDFGGGRNSPVGAIDNSVKPSVVNFYLGRPRSQWISGNANLFCIDGSITTGDSPKSIPAYFKEFFETYDPDMFGFIVSVFAPEPAPQDLIQLSTQKENPYPMPNYADNALSPVISTNTITSEVNIKLMFPHYCSVTAELVADVRLKPIPLGSGAGYMQARMGFPIKCSYRINLEYMGGKFSNIANLEKCNMTRLMLASVCETDVWLPVGSVSESFELMSISAMLNSRRIVNKDGVEKAQEEIFEMSVVLVPLRPGLLPLPPVQYIYSCSYYDGEEISHKADAGKLPSYMASPAAETMLQGTPKTVPKVVSTADALVDLTTPAKRRKSHTMSTPEQLGLTLFQQQQHLPASPSSIIGGRRKKRVTLDPLLSFPEACALVQPDEQIIVPAFSSSFHGTKESVQ